jgi:hypothetical protein
MHATQQLFNPHSIIHITQQLQQQRINPVKQRYTRLATSPAEVPCDCGFGSQD